MCKCNKIWWLCSSGKDIVLQPRNRSIKLRMLNFKALYWPQGWRKDTIKFGRTICNPKMLKVGPKFFWALTPRVKRALVFIIPTDVIWKAEPLCEEQQLLFSNLCLPKSSNSSLLICSNWINTNSQCATWGCRVCDAPCFMLTNITPSLQITLCATWGWRVCDALVSC
jgi:hypothetical protein